MCVIDTVTSEKCVNELCANVQCVSVTLMSMCPVTVIVCTLCE